VLDLLRSRGAAMHWIVNRWENHRIVMLAERIGASWSTTYHWYPFERHTRNPTRLIQMAWDTLMTSLGVLCDARRFRPTHVLMPDFSSVLRTAPALLLLRLWGVPVILRLGNAPDAGPFYRRLWRWGVNPCVSRFVCNSRFTERELLAHGIPAGKVCQIYNTLPSRAEHGLGGAPRDPGKCIYIGQIIPEKGLHVLLETIGLLAARGCDVRLDVVGQMDGWVSPAYEGYRERLLARAAEPDLAGRVRFLGWREDVPALLAGAAVHCCPSLPAQREGFGLVNIEAKQAGIPSVVFPTGALPELITHRLDGWIGHAATAEALAEGLGYFLFDAGRREEAGRAARVSLERFSQERFAQAWWAVFGEPPGSAARRSVSFAHRTLAGRAERRER
jgi:glycosyltransferase involved in cell wall biosynthesis